MELAVCAETWTAMVDLGGSIFLVYTEFIQGAHLAIG